MSVHFFGACATAALLAASGVRAADPAAPTAPKPAEAANVSHTYLGEVTGTVVKVGDGSITLSVPEVVQTGTTHKKVPSPHVPGMKSGGHRTTSITVPKTTTKLVEVTYDLGDAVSVKTVTGKPMTLADVVAGGVARVHVERLREQKVGEKSEPHVVVKSIDIPTPAAAAPLAPIPPAKK